MKGFTRAAVSAPTLASVAALALGFAGLAVAMMPATQAHAATPDLCRAAKTPDEKVDQCSRLIAKQPRRDVLTEALIARGEAYVRKGMATEAIADFTSALAMPGDAPSARKSALIGRATAYILARAFAKAVADYAAVLAVAPGERSALVAKGYAHLAMDDAQAAYDTLTEAVRRAPRDALALNNRALALRKLGRLDEAVADLTTAIQFNPLYALAYNNRGYVYEALGDKPKAINDFRNALAIDPTLTGARDGLVRLSAAATFAADADRQVAAGRALAQEKCAWCHAIGKGAKSRNAAAPPFMSIHERHPVLALRQPITRAIATPHDAMPKLALSDAEVDSIIAYINSLKAAR